MHHNRAEGCTTAAMDNAASSGHMHVLHFLASTRSEGCTVYAMVLAAWHGHLDVLKWLHMNRSEVWHGTVTCEPHISNIYIEHQFIPTLYDKKPGYWPRLLVAFL